MGADLIFQASGAADALLGDTEPALQMAAVDIGPAMLPDALPIPLDAAQVVIPDGQTVVHLAVTPGETVVLPFGSDAPILAAIGNGNLALKVGDILIILEGYGAAADAAPPVIEGADGKALDIAALLAATDPAIEIETAAGPGATGGGQGPDNSGAIFQAFVGGQGGLGGFEGAGGQDDSSGPQGFQAFGAGGPQTPTQNAALNLPPVVSDVLAATDEDTKLAGQLPATDADGDPLTYHVVGVLPAHVTVNPDGSWFFDPANSFDYLAAGDKATITFQFQANDGKADSNIGTATIAVNGVNDVPAISGDRTGKVTEDAGVTAGGTLTVTDADHDEGHTRTASNAASDKGYGTFSVDADGHWIYTLDDSNAAVNALGSQDTLSDTFTVTSQDGTATETVTIRIQGHNDAPVLSTSVHDLYVNEDALAGAVYLGTAAKITDPDSTVFDFVAAGTLPPGITLDSSSVMHFAPAGLYDSLQLGEEATFQVGYQVFDGEAMSNVVSVLVHILGANDPASISGDKAGAVTEDSGLAATGILTVKDLDHDEARTKTASNAASDKGYGTFSVEADGHWRYALDDGNADVNALQAGQTLTDTFGVRAIDGTAQQIAVTINGVNDAPEIGGMGGGLDFTEGDAAKVIDASVTVGDVDSANFNGGRLTVAFAANGTADDQLAILNEGSAAGQIGISGANVTYGGVVIGTWSGGSSGQDLVIDFTSDSATAAAA
jgi:VCBS repeat-containing protein